MKTTIVSIKNFIRNMMNGTNDTSHKRVIALLSFLVLVAMVVVKAKGGQVDSSLIYVFAALTGGQSALSVIEKFKK
ncbi:MAG: hypothetical protein N4A71_22015 [Carboxylicivirga sp.]|jgi:hypothetical protein|nr:hypothetical protein [Carboxylicivirga sp.]